MNITNKLIERLNNECRLDIPIGTKIRHVNPTLNQSARGSFKWFFTDNHCMVGSSMGVRELVKCKEIYISRAVGEMLDTGIGFSEILGH